MKTVLAPDEKEFIREYFEEVSFIQPSIEQAGEPLLTRKEIAAFLKISLVTLHDWMKKGLPSHQQQGRVYFMRSEVLDYLKAGK